MAYIYKITNDINQKIYIGKTERNIKDRFYEHCQDYKKPEKENRPLYRAMKKYGIKHFHIEQIEETNIPEEREKYWIEYYGSFKYGYNATIGGDGKRYLDYDLIFNTYKQCKNLQDTANILNISVDSVKNVLKLNKYPIKTSEEINKDKYGKNVGMFDKSNNLIKTFPSLKKAAKYLIENKKTTSQDFKGIAAHIHHVCEGMRKTAYTYKWQYL